MAEVIQTRAASRLSATAADQPRYLIKHPMCVHTIKTSAPATCKNVESRPAVYFGEKALFLFRVLDRKLHRQSREQCVRHPVHLRGRRRPGPRMILLRFHKRMDGAFSSGEAYPLIGELSISEYVMKF